MTLVMHFYLPVAIYTGHLINYSYGTELHRLEGNRNYLGLQRDFKPLQSNAEFFHRKTRVAVLLNKRCNVDLDLWI